MSNQIVVSNVSAHTSEKELRDFLSFCGRISSLQLTQDGDKQKATVVFDKPSAAKTAILLDKTTLGQNEIHVTASGEDTGATSASTNENEEDPLSQENKPRTRIFAEYLAHGYKIGDKALQHAIQLDNTHGISTRFTKALQDLDKKTGATARAGALDDKYKVTETAQRQGQSAWLGLSSYFEKLAGTETGQRVVNFYTTGEKQVLDIHNEAVRLAGLKDKYNHDASGSEKHLPEPVPGTEGKKTTCTCGGKDGVCGCEAGKCTCSGCAKSTAAEDSNTATGAAAELAASSNVAPLGEKQ